MGVVVKAARYTSCVWAHTDGEMKLACALERESDSCWKDARECLVVRACLKTDLCSEPGHLHVEDLLRLADGLLGPRKDGFDLAVQIAVLQHVLEHINQQRDVPVKGWGGGEGKARSDGGTGTITKQARRFAHTCK